jgi:amidase
LDKQKDLKTVSATVLAVGLQEGRWTSVDLAKHFLSQIAENNPRIHAVPTLDTKQTLAQADESDRRRAAGRPLSALDGLPMTVKDAFRMKGWPSTYGFWMFKDYRPKSDSKVIECLRQSGIVFLGRSITPTGSFDWNCKNQIHAECVNPFAHCCGVFGLRTTDGWLPVDDFGPESFPTAFKRIVTCGPMARNLEDLELLVEIFERNFPHPTPVHTPRKSGPLKIAYSKGILGLSTNHSTNDLFDKMLIGLKNQGHEVEEKTPAFDWESLYEDWGLIGGHEYTSLIPMPLRNKWFYSAYSRIVFQRRLGTGPFLAYFKSGMSSTQTEYESALKRRQRIFKEIDNFFSDTDLWILPVAPAAAIPLALCGKKIPTETGDVEYLKYLGSYCGPTATLGTPVLACPIGNDDEGMPIGVQIHSARFSDRQLVERVSKIEGVFQ